jgi:hypothetical protein
MTALIGSTPLSGEALGRYAESLTSQKHAEELAEKDGDAREVLNRFRAAIGEVKV